MNLPAPAREDMTEGGPAGALLVIDIGNGRPTATGAAVFRTSKAVASEKGRFATSSWNWDGARLHAETSSLGLVSLYYAALPDRFVIATDIRSVMDCAGALTIDRPAMLLFHLLYQYVGGRTAFKEVRVLPLSSNLTWDAATGAVSITRRPLIGPEPVTGADTAIERQCDALLRAAVRKHRGSADHVLTLSGGRDSRHILLALHASGLAVDRIVTAHHYLDFSYADVAVARQLAARVGMPAEVVTPFPDRVAAEIAKNWLTGLQSMGHSWGLTLANATAGTRTVYDGMNGSSLFGRSRMASIERKLFPDAIEPPPWRLRCGNVIDAIVFEDAVRTAPSTLGLPRNVEAARALLAESLDRYAAFPNQTQAFRVFETGPRDFALLTLGLLRNPEVICPFDDESFVAFALGLPWRLSNDYGFHDRVLRSAYPEFADIPYEMDVPGPPGPPLTDATAEWRSFRRAIQTVEPKRAAALIPNLEKMLRQPALTYRQIQRSVYTLQAKAVQIGRDPLLGLEPEELPPLPAGHSYRVPKVARRSDDESL